MEGRALKLSGCRVEQEKECVRWVEKLFKDIKDEISFAFGMASLVCWGVAEIPQIITNFNNKSADGVSLAFIFTWIIGDAFNLVGCILEPATLPTQFYTALLYTTTTIVLALQCIYYDHFLKWWTRRGTAVQVNSYKRSDLTQKELIKHGGATNSPVEVPKMRDFYFMSARSLAGSSSPLVHSYIKPKSGPPALERHDSDSSSEDERPPPTSSSTKPTVMPQSQPQPIPRPSGYGTFLVASAFLPLRGDASFLGRRYLTKIQRGSVAGLNPLMFVFALIANATYVGSIIVRSTEWEKIQANMPWLLDAIVCVALDVFIIMQYIYYRFMKPRTVLLLQLSM